MTARVVCADGAQVLMDYLEGVLAPDLKEAVASHVAGCPRCTAFIQSYRETPRILRAATAAALPPDLAESLSRFLAARRGAGGPF